MNYEAGGLTLQYKFGNGRIKLTSKISSPFSILKIIRVRTWGWDHI